MMENASWWINVGGGFDSVERPAEAAL